MGYADSAKTVYVMLEALPQFQNKPFSGELGERVHTAILPDLELCFQVFEKFRESPLELLPIDALNRILLCGEQFVRFLQDGTENLDFLDSKNVPMAPDFVLRYQERIRDIRLEVMSIAKDWLGFLIAVNKTQDPKRGAFAEINRVLEECKSLREKIEDQESEANKAVSDIIDTMKTAASAAGVGVFTADFHDAAEVFNNEAKRWLWGSMALLATTAVAALVSYFCLRLPSSAPTSDVIQYVSTKIVILGLLITSTIWCARLYKISRHQSVTNRHRANALRTFQAFVSSTRTQEIQDAVLLETTRSIFSIYPSGYIDDGAPQGGEKSDASDLVKLIAKIAKDAPSK